MSFNVVAWVLDQSGATNADRLVLLALASYADDDGGNAYPSVASLCDRAQLSLSAVRDALGRLKDAGRIIETGTGPRRTRAWRIAFDLAADLEARSALTVQRDRKLAASRAKGSHDLDPPGSGSNDPPGSGPRHDLAPARIWPQTRQDLVADPPGSGPDSVPTQPESVLSVELALDGGAASTSPNGNGHAPDVGADRDALADEQPTPAARSRAADVRAVFAAWIEATGRTDRTVLDAKRRRLIEQRLADFPVADLIDAVRGWRESPHHRGENPHRTVYNDLGLLLRDAAHVERFRDLERGAGQPVKPTALTEAEIRARREAVTA